VLEVHLDAYILPRDHQVFKCFPGKAYRFYDLVHDENAVFLDVDGLETLGLDARTWSDQQVLDAVRSDRQRREAFRVAQGRAVPVRTGYSATGYSRTDRRDRTLSIGLYKTAKKGDLVVVPAEGYHRDVLVGELLEGPESLTVVEATGSDGYKYRFVARKVNWLAKIPKHELTGRLINRLHTQTAFFDIGRNSYEEIYDLAYKSYAFEDNFVASFFTTKQHFTSRDNLLASVWFEAMSAVRSHVDAGNGQPLNPLQAASFADLAFGIAQNADRGELSININSPGEFILRSKKEFALAVMAVFALAQASAPYQQAIAAPIVAHVVGTADASCLGRVRDDVRAYIESMEDPTWIDACKTATDAGKTATLKTKARVVPAKKAN